MEAIDINLGDLEPISLNLTDDFSTSNTSSNFGPGIELLMNDKKRSSSNNINIDLGDLDRLENELNELSGSKNVNMSSKPSTSQASSSMFGDTKTLSGLASSMFGFGSSNAQSASKPVEEIERNDSRLGHSTAESIGSNKTWDGFMKMGDVPPGDIGGVGPSARLSEKDKRRKKRMMIKKLEE